MDYPQITKIGNVWFVCSTTKVEKQAINFTDRRLQIECDGCALDRVVVLVSLAMAR